MSLEDLIVTEKRLGEGGFGSVFVCKLGGKEVAAKKLSQSEREIDNLVREASRLKRLQYGKHIAYTYGIILKEENLYMVMEYSEHGDLQNYLKKNKESITYEQKILFCRGILLGLLYCHSMKIFHGDIKCSNVILGKNLEPKLTDFGLSMTVENIENYCKIYEGSIHWTAPELFSMEEESSFEEFKANPYPADFYSLGATFCQVSFDGTTEFIDSYDIEMDISLGLVSPIPKDGFLEEIVDGCCQFECNERISLDKCLTMLDAAIEKQLLVPAMDDKWPKIQQDIKANSNLELPPSFILHRPTGNLVIGPSNLSLLEWLCISDFKDAVEYMIQPYKDDQDQIKWLLEISELCKSIEVADFLRIYMQNSELSHLVLSNLIDNHPQKFVEMLIKAGASSCSYNLLKKAIDRHHNMIVQAVIDTTSSFNACAIYDAVKFGNAKAVKIIVDASVDLELKDLYTDIAPLKIAIDIENIEIVKILLEFIININNKNNSTQISVEAEIQYRLLHLAALKDNREIVKLLIDAGATTDITSNEWFSLSQDLEQQGNVSMARFIRNSISKTSSTVENNPLCTAIQKKQSDLVQRLIVDGEDIDKIDLDGYAPLHWAVIVGDEEAVGILIRVGVDLDIRTSNKTQNLDSAFASDCLSDCTPLHIAISKGYLGIAKVLIESGADFSARNGLQQTIMDIAKEKKMEIEKIVRECAPINIILIRRAMKSMSFESIKMMIKNQQNNAEILSECLCIAASSGKNDLIEYLLKCGVNINKEHRGKTPLWWAILGRNVETMNFLINAGADINAQDQDGIIPLIECIERLNIEMVQFLVDKGADVDVRDEDGYTPVYYTVDKEIAKILINAGTDINARNIYGRTPLIQHVMESNAEMVQFLVDKGADINVRDKEGHASIHYANDSEIMKILINSGADVNARDYYEDAPIHCANDKEIMKILIDAGADINARNIYGQTPLIQYARLLNTEMVQFLVDKGADVNVRDKEGHASIHYANDSEIMKILINSGADINAKNKHEEIPLIHHVKNSNTEMVQFLVDKGADVNARDKKGHAPIHYANDIKIMKILTNAKNKHRETPLIQSVSQLDTEMMQFLVDKGADVNAKDKEGHASIHYANDNEIMKVLINSGANINAKNKHGETLLVQYVKSSNTEMVQFLISKEADVNARDKDGHTPIHYANHNEIVKILINSGADVNAKNKHGEIPLIHHVKNSNIEIVQFLVSKGADVNSRDKVGYAPIHYANDNEIIKILINAGADINAKDQDAIILLIQNVKNSNIEMVQSLVERGADVNARDAHGKVPIHYANKREIMKILINAGADINARNEFGYTPLIQHVMDLNAEMVQFLVDKGVYVNARDKDGNMPIHYANDNEIMKILIKAGADVNKDKNGLALLIQSVNQLDIEMVQSLVDKGADVNVRDKDGNMPIHFAKSREIIEILINAGADIDAKDQYERTCLIQFAKGLNADIIRLLVDKGADVDSRDIYGNTPIHYANDNRIIEILINAGADVNAKNQYGKTPLIRHVKNSNTEMVKVLVDKGADINAIDKDGNTPVHYVRDKEIAEILITAGADISAKDRHGKALFDILIEEQNRNLSSNQYERKKICELLEYLREINKN